MLLDNIALDVPNLLIGIHLLKNALHAILMNPGTIKLICANAAHLQDQFKLENALAHTLKYNGMQILKLVIAHLILMVIIASHVLPQDFGIIIKKSVFAQHLKLNGILQVKNANAQLENTETIALNVLLLDIGMPNKIIVFVQLQELFGMLQR
jgi:hypothetical protein